MLMIFARTYGDGAKLPLLVGKLLVSLVGHFASSIFTVLILAFSIIGPDPKPNGKMQFGEETQLICLLILVGYGFVGWLLCSFVHGKFIKSYSTFNSFAGKPQSIFSK